MHISPIMVGKALKSPIQLNTLKWWHASSPFMCLTGTEAADAVLKDSFKVLAEQVEPVRGRSPCATILGFGFIGFWTYLPTMV